GIGLDPIMYFGHELARIAIIAGEPVRLTEPRKVLASAQFPWDFHIGRPIELVVFDAPAVLQRPCLASLEIGEPGHLLAERNRSRAKQLEFVAKGSICVCDQTLANPCVLVSENLAP